MRARTIAHSFIVSRVATHSALPHTSSTEEMRGGTMKVLTIGAGVVGVTTADSLRAQGNEVTVVDRQDGRGREASFADATLLASSMAEPWNAPGCWRARLSSVGSSDSALKLRPRAVHFKRGLRPTSADGVPIIGPTPIPNLFVNLATGTLAGRWLPDPRSSLTDCLSGSAPAVDPHSTC